MITQLDKTQLEGKGWVFSSKEAPDPSLQSKEVTFTENGTVELLPDEGFTGLSSVTATAALPLEDKNVTITKNGENVITPSEGYAALSSVTATVNVPNVDPEGLWQRPLDRPVKPEMQDNEVRWLFGVRKGSPNDFGVTIEGTGDMLMDWGNGVTTVHSSGSLISYKYTDFDTIPQEVNYAGYKYVWIVARPATQDAFIADVNVNTPPLWRSQSAVFVPNVFEFYVNCPLMSTLSFISPIRPSNYWYGLCDIFGLGRNNLSAQGADKLCWNFRSLQRFDALDIEKIQYPFEYFMENCSSFNGEFPSDLTFHNLKSSNFKGCTSLTRPFRDTVTFANLQGALLQGAAYDRVITIDRLTAKSTSLSVVIGDTVTGLRIKNAGLPTFIKVNVAKTSLDREALVVLFSDLPASGTLREVIISECLGAKQLTAEDRKIATDKGYTIVG